MAIDVELLVPVEGLNMAVNLGTINLHMEDDSLAIILFH